MIFHHIVKLIISVMMEMQIYEFVVRLVHSNALFEFYLDY